MWLIVEGVDVFFNRSNALPLSDLVQDEIAVSAVLVNAILVSKSVTFVHVVKRRIELVFLELTLLLELLNFRVEAVDALLVSCTKGRKGSSSFVSRVFVDSEGALRAQEFWN